LDLDVGSALDQIQAASVQYRVAVGLHAGRKALTLYSVMVWGQSAQGRYRLRYENGDI